MVLPVAFNKILNGKQEQKYKLNGFADDQKGKIFEAMTE